MATRVVSHVDVPLPPDEVWARFLRLNDWPRWFPALTAVDCNRPQLAVGAQLTLHLQMAGRGAKVTCTVQQLDDQRVRWVGRAFGVTGDHSFFVERRGDGARFTSDETFSGFPLLLVPKRYLEPLQLEADAGLLRFAALCQPPAPEDG